MLEAGGERKGWKNVRYLTNQGQSGVSILRSIQTDLKQKVSLETETITGVVKQWEDTLLLNATL